MVDLARHAQRTLQNLFFVFITVTLVFAVVQQWYDQLWVGVLIHELSVVIASPTVHGWLKMDNHSNS